MDPVLASILSLTSTCISAVALIYTVRSFASNKNQNDAQLVQRLVILETKMDNLTSIVNKHNGVIERTYNVERDSQTMWRRIDENRESIGGIQDELEKIKLTLAQQGIGGTD